MIESLLAILDRVWRFFATALSFVVFGLGGLLIPLLAVPLLYLISGPGERRAIAAKRLIHRSFRLYIELMRYLNVLTYEVVHRERLEGAGIVVANHPTLIDVIFLIAMLPNANCVVKRRLISNLFTRGPVTAAGYITNDEASGVISASRAAISRGEAVIIFPEGTRTVPGESLRLKRGAANIAIRCGERELTPVLIECTPNTLSKGDRWYHIPKKRVHIRFSVGERLPIDQYADLDNLSRGARRLTEDLTHYFNQRLGNYG